MKLQHLCIAFGLMLLVTQVSQGQTTPTPAASSSRARQFEFVESSSPLGDGRRVTRVQYTDQRTSRLAISSPPLNRTARVSQARIPQSPTRTAFQQPAANTVPALGQPPNTLGGMAPPNPNCQNCQPAVGNRYFGQVYPYPVQQPPAQPVFNNAFARGPQPILRLRTMPANAYLGQGIIGQPTAYVPGEPLRNIIRYIMP